MTIKPAENNSIPHAPAHLYERIRDRIELYERRRARRNFFSHVVLFVSSNILCMVGVLRLLDESFLQYVRLVFSDWQLISSMWQDFLFTLAESLPFTTVAIVLGGIFFLLVSLRGISGSMKSQYSYKGAL